MTEKLSSNICICCLPLKSNPLLEQFINDGKLKCSSTVFCDQRIPFTFDEINNQDIDCVGPNNPDCPKKPLENKSYKNLL
jgi:hypothetical protein